MIDQVGAETGSVAFNPPGASPPRSPHQGPADASSDLKFFGNDGFTFLDFLDVINPLQHIPVVSALYRSITGDSIDPGAKIAGGTLFGGPLGAALSGLDVAVKHSTGLDITDHAVAFFTGTKNDQNTPAPAKTGLETASLEPAKMGNRSLEIQSSDPALRPIEAGLMPLTGDPLKPPLLKTQTGEGRFQSAGMFAIPIAKRPSGAESQGAAITLKSLPDLGMLGDITQLTAPNGQLGSKKDTSGLTLFPQGVE